MTAAGNASTELLEEISAMQETQLLQMRGISKAFAGVQALDKVDFDLQAGEVMALVGENGAGKSTLVKALAGAQLADEGEIYLDGKLVEIPTPRRARELGISVIYQELELAEKLSIAENIFVGREFRDRFGLVDYKTMNREARALLDELHVDVDPRTEVRRLSIAHKQMVEIARALSMDARIIVMDEPTSSLPTTTVSGMLNEVEILLRLIESLRARGKSVVYISHRLNEIFEISDRITVLRDGHLVGVTRAAETNPDKVVSMMVGRELRDLYGSPRKREIGKTVLAVKELTRKGKHGPISFEVRAGEIVGVAGLIGAGRTEMALTLFGVHPNDGGEVWIDDQPVMIKSPQHAIQHGIGYVPEDRKQQGLFLKKSVRNNISAAISRDISQWGFLKPESDRRVAHHYIDELKIRTPSMEQQTKNLSGGNQQKVVLAKWMASNPKVLVLDEPTRGVDVGAKAEIYALMHEMVDQGMAVVMISSELPEILGMSDRVVVMREGKYSGELSRAEANEESVMALATGLKGGV
jgi:ABC-type sugar transport system ATPase subunit